MLPPHTTHIAQPLDRGCFSPLKTAWRRCCHEFRAHNPGRVITRYEFSQLFSKAWFRAMSASNIISSFKVTGVCPFNRNILNIGQEETRSVFEPQRLADRTGLAYIPLYSLSRSHRPSISTPTSHHHKPMTSTPKDSFCSLSDSEISKSPHSASRLLKGSFDDTSYAQTTVPLRRATSTSKFLVLPPAPNRIATKVGKSSGCVLTSQENLMKIAEKERKRLEVAQKKEERKNEREERKLQQNQLMKKQPRKGEFK